MKKYLEIGKVYHFNYVNAEGTTAIVICDLPCASHHNKYLMVDDNNTLFSVYENMSVDDSIYYIKEQEYCKVSNITDSVSALQRCIENDDTTIPSIYTNW